MSKYASSPRPNPRIAALKGWIQEQHLQDKTIAAYGKQFQKNTPFPHVLIKDFLVKKQIDFLKNALEKLVFEKKDSDLFSFAQTSDLSRSTSFVFGSLHTMLSSSYFLKSLQEIAGLPKLKPVVDLHAIRFTKTCYLLPHDDTLDDRKVAYVLYLSSLAKKQGGALEFFSVNGQRPIKIVKSYPCLENSLMLFAVSRQSVHHVAEVVDETERLTLGGWFHG